MIVKLQHEDYDADSMHADWTDRGRERDSLVIVIILQAVQCCGAICRSSVHTQLNLCILQTLFCYK